MELLLTGFCQVFSKYNVVIHDHHWLCVMTRPSASCVTIVSVSGAVARWGGVSSIPSQDVRKVSSNILYLYNPTDLSLFDGCVIWPPPWTIFSMVSPLMVECLSSTILIEFQVWARDHVSHTTATVSQWCQCGIVDVNVNVISRTNPRITKEHIHCY